MSEDAGLPGPQCTLLQKSPQRTQTTSTRRWWLLSLRALEADLKQTKKKHGSSAPKLSSKLLKGVLLVKEDWGCGEVGQSRQGGDGQDICVGTVPIRQALYWALCLGHLPPFPPPLPALRSKDNYPHLAVGNWGSEQWNNLVLQRWPVAESEAVPGLSGSQAQGHNLSAPVVPDNILMQRRRPSQLCSSDHFPLYCLILHHHYSQ